MNWGPGGHLGPQKASEMILLYIGASGVTIRGLGRVHISALWITGGPHHNCRPSSKLSPNAMSATHMHPSWSRAEQQFGSRPPLVTILTSYMYTSNGMSATVMHPRWSRAQLQFASRLPVVTIQPG